MATYSAVAAGEKDADSPITVSLIDKLDQNPHAIAEGASGAPKIQTAALNDNAVTQAKVANSAIGQAQLKTNTQEEIVSTSVTGTYTTTVVATVDDYMFEPYVKINDASGVSLLRAFTSEYSASLPTAFQANVKVQITTSVGLTRTGTARWRYIDSSPPHNVNGLDYDDFIFLNLDSSGNVIGGSIDKNPPWFFNGPTNCRYDRIVNGKKIRRDFIVPDEIKALIKTSPKDYRKELKKLAPVDIEITEELKHKDMLLIPHPFLDHTGPVVIIEPSQGGVYRELCEIRETGEAIGEIIVSHCKIDSTDIKSAGKPPGVGMHRIKWKNTGN
ncbi:MAG: hypothetical protein ACPGPF_01580 [Pontibacterium sp.]